ncbi:NblA/ycf18 family protein [Nostoc sp. CHAB 5836]|uniref:NblA/ycf18 family protein n=1 Tax=Nostoc sp. CHAB 5836 TaxID=2780404 RepID=UPI001E640423|nr:NblA/ycf18 family protein [Nostoc sp. CHAB 5836]MCC5617487.1 NblA/ycf18 family protein [Nostoc sp. CHAB 5836]
MGLTPEQEFKICSFNRQVENISETEVKQMLVEMYQQMFERQNYYQDLLILFALL